MGNYGYQPLPKLNKYIPNTVKFKLDPGMSKDKTQESMAFHNNPLTRL